MIEYKQNFFESDIEWDDLFINFNESIIADEKITNMSDYYFLSENAIKIEKLKPLYDKLKVNVAHLYMSLTTKSAGHGKHNDTDDVWYWQCKGITQWQGEDFKHILMPGDLIYVPKGIYHQVTSLSPRAGISMSKN